MVKISLTDGQRPSPNRHWCPGTCHAVLVNFNYCTASVEYWVMCLSVLCEQFDQLRLKSPKVNSCAPFVLMLEMESILALSLVKAAK